MEQNDLADSINANIGSSRFELSYFDDVLVRKIVECVKIISKEEIIITFKGGHEVRKRL